MCLPLHQNKATSLYFLQTLRLIFEEATLTQGHRGPLWKLDWMRCTAHVCTLWRCVALDHAALWTYIDLNAPIWVVNEKLSRSKEAPLTVIFNMSPPHMQDLRLVWKHTFRIRDLSIVAESDSWSHLVQKTIPDMADVAENLESFSLTFEQGDRPHAILSSNIFARGTPNLRNFQLIRCGLDWNSPFLAGLTTLFLSMPGSRRGRPSLAQFFTALGTMNNLETLVLHNILPYAIGSPISNLRRTRALPRLTSIDIVSNTLECIQLLQHFACPSIDFAKFRLNSRTSQCAVHYADIMTNLSALATEDGLFLRHPIRSIDCHYLEDFYKLEFILWDVCNDHPFKRRARSPRLHFVLRLYGESPHLQEVEVLRSLSKMLPPEEIQSLSLSRTSLVGVDWSSHIHQFKSLRWLYACDTGTSDKILEDLSQQSPLDSPLYLPILQGLVIEHYSFTGIEGHFDGLLRYLERRACCQQPLTSLHLIRCTTSDEQLCLLEKTVPNIIVSKRREYAFFE